MGYLHIDNLYKNQDILLFKECYALEKIHGTSAHISWKDDELHFYAGGEKHVNFVGLFDEAALRAHRTGGEKLTVFGEAYGGKQQAQSWRYGKALKFVAFDVRIGELWLSVPQAAAIVNGFGLEFVHYVRVATDLPALNAERDAPSEQARRNGIEGDQPREGVVLRPLVEFTKNNGDRIISKHKRDEERETKTPRVVGEKAEVLAKAQSIADEWVTPMRLQHVLQKMPGASIEQTRDVIVALLEDVLREGAGELVDTEEARRAVMTRGAHLFKQHLRATLCE